MDLHGKSFFQQTTKADDVLWLKYAQLKQFNNSLIKPDFPSLIVADEIAEPRPDMNIKVVTFTAIKKLY